MWEMGILYAIGRAAQWAFNNGFTILLFVFLTIIVVQLNTIYHQMYIGIARGLQNMAAAHQTITNLISKIDEVDGHLYRIQKELEAGSVNRLHQIEKELEAINRREEKANGHLYQIQKELEKANGHLYDIERR